MFIQVVNTRISIVDRSTSASKNYETLLTTKSGIILATTVITLIPWRHCANIVGWYNDIGQISSVTLEKEMPFCS